VDTNSLVARLRRVPGSDGLTHLEAFDPDDDAHVDEAARLLLERFRDAHDTEAFTLLFELTHGRLARIADRLTRRYAPMVEPDDLASTFMARLFADVGRRGQPVRRFLGLASTAMRNELFDQLRQIKRARDNVQHVHDTLDDVVDPFQEAVTQEEDALLGQVGDALIRLTGDCFHDLDERDKHVLLAREILRLPYDRVAGMLALDQQQVGMIIRRARQHLADSLLERLGELTDDLPETATQRVHDLVLRCLGSRDRVKNMRTLVKRMLDRSAAEGRRRLADLVYELAKSRLLAVPSVQSRTLVTREPRRHDAVADDVRHLAARLRHMDGELDVAGLERDEGPDALVDALDCLDTLHRIEGESGRQQVAVALCHIHQGRLEEAERVLRALIHRELSPLTRQNVFRNLTLTLLRQERWADALEVTDECADEWPADPVRVMNACYAAARLGLRARFEDNARALRRMHELRPTTQVAGWIHHELPKLADALGLSHHRPATSPDAQGEQSGGEPAS